MFQNASIVRMLFAAILANINPLMAAEKIVLVAGGEKEQVAIAAVDARLYEPFAAEFDSLGNLWIVEMASANRLLRIQSDGLLYHVAGHPYKAIASQSASIASEVEPALTAKFNGPHNIAISKNNSILVADTWNGRIRSFDPKAGTVGLVAGYAVGPEKAKSSGPYCIALNPAKTKLYVADLNVIQCMDLESGAIQILAGNGKKGIPSDDGIAIESPLVDPRAVAVDSHDNIYILERGGNALRKVSSDGRIRTVVNGSGKKGLSDVRMDALQARMNGPKHLCIDREDCVIIADAENHVVLRYDPREQMVSRIAGTGKHGKLGLGGPPTDCQLARPHGVSVHPQTGELVITDSYNDRIVKIIRD